jgi:hypothetical protein
VTTTQNRGRWSWGSRGAQEARVVMGDRRE